MSEQYDETEAIDNPDAEVTDPVVEDDVLEATLEAGAEEVNDLGESFEVVTEATDLVAVRSS